MNVKLPTELEFDWQAACCEIVEGIRSYFKKANSQKGVIGLSGGLDSSVTAALAVKAMGKQNVFGVVMPERGTTPEEDIEDAYKLAESLEIEHKTIEIAPIVDAVTRELPGVTEKDPDCRLKRPMAYANIKPRVRMTILYANANLLGNALVLGTGNRSELLLGYCTKHGDHGVDLLPIGDLYKTQVRYMAERLELFERIWKKPPSPRLLKNQTAESEIGVGYDVIDRVLYYRVEKGYGEEKIVNKLAVSREIVNRLCSMIKQSQHKREVPPICRVSSARRKAD